MDKKKFSLLLIFIFFVFGHFYRLSSQKFVGDEASPILLVDRAWDILTTKDIKLLAFPFLWYHDPFRAVIAGTLIHLTGMNQVLLRLPGIGFSLGIYWLLVWIFSKEKIPATLTVLSLLAYSSAATLMDYRLASGDSQGVFLILWAGYLIYKKSFNRAPWVLLAACLTMLDAVILIPALIFRAKFKSWIKPGFIFAVYLLLWLVLPYLAYRLGHQPWFANRGLWYYLSRVSEGAAVDPLLGFKALTHYSSWLFTAWLFLGSIGSWLTAPAWLAVLLLNRSSSHILMYVGLFLFQAVLASAWLWKRNLAAKILVSVCLLLITYFNGRQLYFHFIANPLTNVDRFVVGHTDVPFRGQVIDEAVKVLYQRYSTSE